ncbi:MAG: DUF599 family protein [Pseudomonadota bacterium]
MDNFQLIDVIAIIYFAVIWVGYARFAEWKRNNAKCLNQIMEQYRFVWFKTFLKREQRMIDTGVMMGLQNGTGFFASCALFAIGGTISLLANPENIRSIVLSLPYTNPGSPVMWTLKIIGLTMIFVYAFFKLAWAYRLFNYSAIMIGASPVREERDTEAAKDITDKGARLNIVASHHFNRGMRAFFFALGYLGWFIHPIVFMAVTTFTAVVLYKRIFASDALKALL